MTTDKQIEANRKNAKLSTGPVTSEGKAVVSRNAIRHGILSNRVLINDEEKELHEEFCASMMNQLQPTGSLEAYFTERIISTAWRLRHIVNIETLMLEKAKRGYMSTSYREAFEGNSARNMSLLSRYERSLENSLYRALKELNSLKQQDELELVGAST